MSQGYKANRLAHVLNSPEAQPRAIPISRILNPTAAQSRSIPLSQILNPLPEQADAICRLSPAQHGSQFSTPSQIFLTPASDDIGPVTLAPFVNLVDEDPELIPDSPIFNPTRDVPELIANSPISNIVHEEPVDTPYTEIPNGRRGKRRLEFVASEQTPSDAEKNIAKQIAESIVQALQGDAEAPRAEFWRTLDPNRSQLEMAELLWDRSRCEEDARPTRWVNRFYASCMRQVLRRRGLIPLNVNNEDSQKQSKDRYAAATDIVNMAADKFGDGVYAGLASAESRFSSSIYAYLLIRLS